MRMIGDSYVREEFRSLKKATPSQFAQFKDQWNRYASVLREQSGDLGQDMAPQELDSLSPEQLQKLHQLRDGLDAK